jgi:hypothetical protein
MSEKLPVYAGTGPVDRVRAFLDALDALDVEHGPKSPLEPRGVAGVPGQDGFYHDLLADDLRSLLSRSS